MTVVPLRASDQAPPHNLSAEEAVLGAVLIAPACLRGLIVEEGLRPEHFYRDRHRRIFEAMMAMSDAEHHVDALTITAHLREMGALEDVGGPAGIEVLAGSVPALGGLRRYAQLVIGEWRWRQRRESAYEQLAAQEARDEPALEVALQKAQALVALGSAESYADPHVLAEHMWRWLDSKPEEGLPVPAELASLGRMIRFRPGHTTVVAGWSHHGKTLLAGQFVEAAGARGHRAVIWTNEDTAEELVARYLNRVTGVPAATITDRQFDAVQAKRIVAEIEHIPFGVQPCFGWDATQIARHIRQERPAVAVVDHFHALPGVGKTEGIDEAIQTLVAAAGQTPCHLFVVCQLNQARNMSVARPAPVGRDLRGSGQLYALAHNVLLVHREEEEDTDVDGRRLGRAVQLTDGHVDVVKNKPTGKLGAVPVVFDSRRLRFVEPGRVS